ASDFTSIDKDALLSLCKNENLCMDENKLWDNIVRWGKARNDNLLKTVDNWTQNDFNMLKEILDDFIPHIRFYDISSEDFCFKVMPYSEILTKDLYYDLSKYHIISNWQPKFNNLISRKKADLSDT